MSNNERTPKAPEPSVLDESRSSDAVPGSQQLPPVQGDKSEQPGDAGSPHHGQSGHGGSGKDAELQSVGQSQSDRAAGSSS